MCFFEVHSRFTCSIFTFTVGSREGVYVNSRFTFNRFSCTHGFARLCLAPHLWWGQKPLMLFSLFRGKSTTTKERSDKMEIKIRYVDPVAVKKIDKIAKEKKISRQEFLKGQIETLAVFQEQKDREAELENIIYQNIKMMEKCAVAIETINGFIQDMMGEEEE